MPYLDKGSRDVVECIKWPEIVRERWADAPFHNGTRCRSPRASEFTLVPMSSLKAFPFTFPQHMQAEL